MVDRLSHQRIKKIKRKIEYNSWLEDYELSGWTIKNTVEGEKGVRKS